MYSAVHQQDHLPTFRDGQPPQIVRRQLVDRNKAQTGHVSTSLATLQLANVQEERMLTGFSSIWAFRASDAEASAVITTSDRFAH